MVQEFNENDIDEVNCLLNKLNYKIDENIIFNDFLKIIVYKLNKIIGVLVYDLIYDRIEIEYIIVDESNRRKGVATALLNYIKKENVKNISLEVRCSNTDAIDFYIKNGFEKVALRKNYYGNEDGILMIKRISD